MMKKKRRSMMMKIILTYNIYCYEIKCIYIYIKLFGTYLTFLQITKLSDQNSNIYLIHRCRVISILIKESFKSVLQTNNLKYMFIFVFIFYDCIEVILLSFTSSRFPTINNLINIIIGFLRIEFLHIEHSCNITF